MPGPPSADSRFVPVLRPELVALLRETLDEAQREPFGQFAALLRSIMQYDFSQRMERLKTLYRPYDPDPIATTIFEAGEDGVSPEAPNTADGVADGVTDTGIDAEANADADDDADTAPDELCRELRGLLDEANFREVTAGELAAAFDAESLFTLSVQVDLEDYAELVLYRRGETVRTERVRGWQTLWRWREIEVPMFQRLMMAIRLKPEALEAHRQLGRVREMEANKVYLKFFKNIPKADLEMIFPTTRLGMNRGDKLRLGLPLAGGLLTTLVKLLAMLGLAAGGFGALGQDDSRGLQAVGAVLLVLSGYILRTFNNYKSTKLNYLRTLSEGLYFRNLDNNAGVLHHLLASAEEEETKEALLAYVFLLRAGEPLSQAELDRRVEAWFAERCGRHFDFEVRDGVASLRELKLISGDTKALSAIPLAEALQALDAHWDGYRSYEA